MADLLTRLGQRMVDPAACAARRRNAPAAPATATRRADLERDLAAEVCAVDQVDDAHPALAEEPLDLVGASSAASGCGAPARTPSASSPTPRSRGDDPRASASRSVSASATSPASSQAERSAAFCSADGMRHLLSAKETVTPTVAIVGRREGLLPWATTGNGSVLLWRTAGPPDGWRTTNRVL